MNIIVTSQCEKYIYSPINEENRPKITVYCGCKEKSYYWGRCVTCNNYKPEKE